MALVDATTFKAQLATAAAALTTALQDDTVSTVAADIRNPHHPLRRIENFFILNKANGVVTANDDYVDAAYAGRPSQEGILYDGVATIPTALVSATVEALAPTDIVLTFDRSIKEFQMPSLGGDSDPAKSIKRITIEGAVVTITVDTAYVALAVITVSGTAIAIDNNSVILADQAVTNNVV